MLLFIKIYFAYHLAFCRRLVTWYKTVMLRREGKHWDETRVVYHLQNVCGKIRLKRKRNTTFCVVPAENFLEQRNVVFRFLKTIFESGFKAFTAVCRQIPICTNGKCDYGTKFNSPKILLTMICPNRAPTCLPMKMVNNQDTTVFYHVTNHLRRAQIEYV